MRRSSGVPGSVEGVGVSLMALSIARSMTLRGNGCGEWASHSPASRASGARVIVMVTLFFTRKMKFSHANEPWCYWNFHINPVH